MSNQTLREAAEAVETILRRFAFSGKVMTRWDAAELADILRAGINTESQCDAIARAITLDDNHRRQVASCAMVQALEDIANSSDVIVSSRVARAALADAREAGLVQP
jgi:hypothetical protein